MGLRRQEVEAALRSHASHESLVEHYVGRVVEHARTVGAKISSINEAWPRVVARHEAGGSATS